MIISAERKYVFVSTPKAATHAVYETLLAHCAGARHGRWHQRCSPRETAGWFRFTVVRNPFSRAVSCWWHLFRRDGYRQLWRRAAGAMEFGQFMRALVDWRRRGATPEVRGDVILTPQAVWHRRSQLDAAVHLERLAAEWPRLPFVRPGEPPPRRLDSYGAPCEASTYGDWREIMTDEAAELVLDWAKADFDAYGYDRDWHAAVTGLARDDGATDGETGQD